MFLGRMDEARTLYLRYRGTKNVQGRDSLDTIVLQISPSSGKPG
jgi:hypothetical protein